MSSQVNTGGPAFPEWPSTLNGISQLQGMSLRDHFAGKAMQGFMANDALLSRFSTSAKKENILPNTLISTAAYAVADAMLAAREVNS